MPDLNATKSSLKLVDKRSSDQNLMEQPAISLQITDEIERSTKAKVRFSGNDEYYSQSKIIFEEYKVEDVEEGTYTPCIRINDQTGESNSNVNLVPPILEADICLE